MSKLNLSLDVPFSEDFGDVLGDAGVSYFVAAEGRFCVGDASDSRWLGGGS